MIMGVMCLAPYEIHFLFIYFCTDFGQRKSWKLTFPDISMFLMNMEALKLAKFLDVRLPIPLKTCFDGTFSYFLFCYLATKEEHGWFCIDACVLIFHSWTIQQALLPGDQYILSSAAQEHSLPAYTWHVVTGLHAVQLFIQHIRPAADGPHRAERSLPYISSARRLPKCICLESQSGRAVV